MEIFGLEKMSMVDYDGKVCATIFTGSCNFRCEFCHNSPLVLDFKTLPQIPEEEVLAYLEKRKNLLDGVCISGGEPTLCKDLPIFIEKIKKIGYSVKLDTNGTNPDLVKMINENKLVDYFAMDIKNDKQNYAKICGFDNYDTGKVQKTVEYFLSGKADYEFRTTLIKEYHYENNILEIAKWLQGANKYFLQKFKNSESCIKTNLSAVEDDVALNYKQILQKYIPNTYLRGYGL